VKREDTSPLRPSLYHILGGGVNVERVLRKQNKEEEMENKKYWLKLQKDFLKSTHIRVIKNMPNGKDYIIFYLALMLESIEYVGHLRFSDLVPYNEEMLASITETNVDIVRSAVKIFTQLGLMEYLDDGTIYMTQVAQMIGKESDSAERVRQYRLRQQDQKALQCNNEVTNSNDIKRKKEDIDIKKEDIDIKKEDIDNLKTTTIDIYSNIEANFGRPLSPMEYEKISNWLSLFEEEIILYAVNIAVFNNKRTFNYVNGILNNWKANGYRSIQEIKDEENNNNPYRELTEEEIKRKENLARNMEELGDYNWLEDTED